MKTIFIEPYNNLWPQFFAEECTLLSKLPIIKIEHIGSTAIPNQKAKPIIDMMATVTGLDSKHHIIQMLAALKYELIQTGMKNRFLFSKHGQPKQVSYNLHIVDDSTWDERKERLMRDYLLAHPKEVIEYNNLKERLAKLFPNDLEAYTKGKTAFVQRIIDIVRKEKNLPPIDVWND